MGKILTAIAYSACTIFWWRFILHIIFWYKSVKNPAFSPAYPKASLRMFAKIAVDVIFFRRLFKVNKLLWIGSWAFHISFLLILLRHLKYFIEPVPDWIMSIQPAGEIAGYILPVSLLYILILRMMPHRDRYVSYYNLFILALLFIISMTGLLMNKFFMPDLIDVKVFIMGILIFTPEIAPESFLFFAHFLMVLVLVPYIPIHMLAAPIVTIEAGRREHELETTVHEKRLITDI